MTATMLAGILAGRKHQAIDNDDPGAEVEHNVLFQSWVNDIDIEHLLGVSDLFNFISVDGGVFGNEPLELARARLHRNMPEAFAANKTDRILLLIDPFPDTNDFEAEIYHEPQNLKSLLFALIAAMKNQGRFKPAELAMAARSVSTSRRIIAPHRAGTKLGQAQIASGLLGGFSGFLDRKFHYHDFMLGRANCQAFLREHFALPADNELIACWTEAQRQSHQIGTDRYPVIPLYGDVRENISVPAWPKLTEHRLDHLHRLLKQRINKMLPLLFREIVPGNSILRGVAVALARFTQTDAWAKRICQQVKLTLSESDLS